MNERYCLPIVRRRQQEVFDEIEREQDNYAYFEVWLDYGDEADVKFVRELDRRYSGKIVLVFRREQLEPIKMPVTGRLEILRALDSSPVLVDMDVHRQKAEFELIQSEKLQLQIIGSYHNYQETPSDDNLREIVADIKEYDPEVVKVAAFCRDENDALRLLSLQLELKARHQRHIVLGMGPNGVITRVFGPLWGNELVFAPKDGREASAPGQLTRQQLDAIFENLVLI